MESGGAIECTHANTHRTIAHQDKCTHMGTSFTNTTTPVPGHALTRGHVYRRHKKDNGNVFVRQLKGMKISKLVTKLISCGLRTTTQYHFGPFFFPPKKGTRYYLGGGPAIAQAVSSWLPTAAARVRVRADHMVFVVDKTALGQVFSEYFDFPCRSLHQSLHHHNHPGLAQ
jgi:hypothetical protein